MSENTSLNKEEKKDLDILNKMKKIPGGLVIIPLVIAVIIATFFPSAFQIGGYVTALFYNGNAAMMGLFLIVCGSAINIKQVGMPLYKGITLTGIKFLLGVAFGLFVGKILVKPASLELHHLYLLQPLQTQTVPYIFHYHHSLETQQIPVLFQYDRLMMGIFSL